MAPLYDFKCPKCNNETTKLLDVCQVFGGTVEGGAKLQPAIIMCECGSTMEKQMSSGSHKIWNHDGHYGSKRKH